MSTPLSTALQQARQRLQSYLAAEAKILESQEYLIGNGGTARRNRRADLQQVQQGIRDVRAEIALLEAQGADGGPAGRRITYLRPF